VNQATLKILKMVEEGAITAEQASDLLDSLKEKRKSGRKRIHLLVFPPNSDEPKLNLELPLGIAKFIYNIVPEDIIDDLEAEDIPLREILDNVDKFESTKVLDMVTDDGKRIVLKIE
jgi:hypothetical protein